MAVVASATGAAVFGLSGVAAGVAGGALLGAGAGALYSGITGDGNVLNSALTGGLLGATAGGLGAAFAPAAAGGASAGAGAGASGLGAVGTAAPTASTVASAANTPALASAALNATPSSYMAGAGLEAGSFATPAFQVAQGAAPVAINPATGLSWEATGSGLTGDGALVTAKDLASAEAAGSSATGLNSKELLGYGLAGTAAMSLLGGMNQKKLSSTTGTTPSYIRPYTYNISQNQSAYPTGPLYGSNGLPIIPTKEQKYFNQSYTAGTPYQAAEGGLMTDEPPVPSMMKSGPADVNFMGSDMYPTSQQHRAYYATPTQMPTSAQHVAASYEPMLNPLTGQPSANMAAGGQVNLQGTFTSGDEGKGSNPFEQQQQSLGGLYGGFGGFGPEARAFQQANPQGGPEAQQGQMSAIAAMLRDMNVQQGQNSSNNQSQSNWGGPGGQGGMPMYNGPTQSQMRNIRSINFADGGITYDAATQTYKGLPSLGVPVADVPVLDAPPPQAGNQDPFSMFGNFGPMAEAGMGGQSGQEQFTPATSLYKNELGDLTTQWQAANPNARTYNAANQTYGAGKPTNAQLLALKNAQAQQAYNDRLQAYQAQGYANGGGIPGNYNLGSYSDGGRLLKGPGDGVSDDIPAVIGDKQPARLADGEFVVPARIVSELGNGSTDAGAKRLYAMMDRIQSGRKKTIGKDKVAVNTKSDKHLPA